MKKIQLLIVGIFMGVLLSTVNTSTTKAAEHTNTEQEFIAKIKDYAIQSYKEHKILPSLTISQAILESGFGESTLTEEANNLFGIKAYSDWNGATFHINTKEFIKGRYVYIYAPFKSYPSYKDSIFDHNILLCTEKYESVRASNNYVDACNAIQKCGYATAPNYSKTLIKIIEQYKLYYYDKIATELLPEIEVTKSVSNILNVTTALNETESVDITPVASKISFANNEEEHRNYINALFVSLTSIF